MRARWAVSVVLAASACGGEHTQAPDADAPVDSDGMIDTDAGDGFEMLIQRSWTVPALTEKWFCRRQTITEDIYVTGLRPLSPQGTDHEILTIAPDATSLGNYDCDSAALVSTPPQPMLFAGGAGTKDFLMPAGVAVKIPAGTTLQLYVHVFNESSQAITETSGISVKKAAASAVTHEADMMFLGKRDFTIPSAAADYNLTTDCGAPVDWHIVGLWPHMHEYGTHQKIEITRAGTTRMTPLDVAYDFADQKNYSMDIAVPTNDRISLTCTWFNTSGQSISSSDATRNEMCYAGVFVYPKVNNLYFCRNL